MAEVTQASRRSRLKAQYANARKDRLAKQRIRSTANILRRLKNHLERHPNDTTAQAALERRR